MPSPITPQNDKATAAEQAYWSGEISLEQLHQFYQTLEKTSDEDQHHFVIVIPVADRPEQLKTCLNSIKTQCDCFQYGGFDGHYKKISVIVADDSQQKAHIKQAKLTVDFYTAQGLKVEYFGLAQQWGFVENLVGKSQYETFFGRLNKANFSHKGASITRNICYLRLQQIVLKQPKTLFFFIDSDEQLQVKVSTNDGDKNCVAVNYFYHLNQIFNTQSVDMISAKYVGDPPVSPAVMANNFLQDVIGFINSIQTLSHNDRCAFHSHKAAKADDAAYHDMASLFGFNGQNEHYDYHCSLLNEHTNRACFRQFSARLNHFFYGEHPTRKSYFNYSPVMQSLKSARTVYTGNYVFNAEGLKHFIPFAQQKLRMAGPTLGRFIQHALGSRFKTVNLPVLHQRTLDITGQSEFRPGIKNNHETMDLSGEFERQFFGDVMLFSIIKMLDEKVLTPATDRALLEPIYQQVETEMLALYQQKHQQIIEKNTLLKRLIENKNVWWNKDDRCSEALSQCQSFISNIANNFGDASLGYQQIQSSAHRQIRKEKNLAAILQFFDDKKNWLELLKR